MSDLAALQGLDEAAWKPKVLAELDRCRSLWERSLAQVAANAEWHEAGVARLIGERGVPPQMARARLEALGLAGSFDWAKCQRLLQGEAS